MVSEPVSEHIRWERYVTHANITAGEEVRWLPRRRATSIPLPRNDFRLFGGALLRVHHFSGDEVVVEDEITADLEAVRLCSTAFEAVWERVIPQHRYKI